MTDIKIIEKKIAALGGVRKNPSCEDDVKLGVNSAIISEFEQLLGGKFPDMYKSMYSIYGPFSFQKSVRVKCEAMNPIGDSNNKVAVDYFYSITKNGKCSIGELLTTYSEQLPKYLLPVCDGEPGDLICISIKESNYGKIYYWHHEGDVDNDLSLVAGAFDDFILRLEVSEDIEGGSEAIDKMEIKASDKLLEMLRKSGFGPKS